MQRTCINRIIIISITCASPPSCYTHRKYDDCLPNISKQVLDIVKMNDTLLWVFTKYSQAESKHTERTHVSFLKKMPILFVFVCFFVPLKPRSIFCPGCFDFNMFKHELCYVVLFVHIAPAVEKYYE